MVSETEGESGLRLGIPSRSGAILAFDSLVRVFLALFSYQILSVRVVRFFVSDAHHGSTYTLPLRGCQRVSPKRFKKCYFSVREIH